MSSPRPAQSCTIGTPSTTTGEPGLEQCSRRMPAGLLQLPAPPLLLPAATCSSYCCCLLCVWGQRAATPWVDRVWWSVECACQGSQPAVHMHSYAPCMELSMGPAGCAVRRQTCRALRAALAAATAPGSTTGTWTSGTMAKSTVSELWSINGRTGAEHAFRALCQIPGWSERASVPAPAAASAVGAMLHSQPLRPTAPLCGASCAPMHTFRALAPYSESPCCCRCVPGCRHEDVPPSFAFTFKFL